MEHLIKISTSVGSHETHINQARFSIWYECNVEINRYIHVIRHGNVSADIKCLMSSLKSDLENGNFWYNYILSSSPGDGHCLVHSVHKCMNHLGEQIKFQDILDTIENETHKNAKIYQAFMNGNFTNVLIGEMKAYIDEKRYDSWA